jgi:uncharacterized protein (TIGR00106 family)
MIVAEIRVVPVGTGSSMEETVEAVCDALEDCEIPYEVGAVSTTFEVDNLEDLMETVRCCQEAAIATSPRVILNLTIDHRTDEEETMDSLRGTEATKSKGDGSSSRQRQGGESERRAAKPTRESVARSR